MYITCMQVTAKVLVCTKSDRKEIRNVYVVYVELKLAQNIGTMQEGGCGTVGRVVALKTGVPGFESYQRKIFLYIYSFNIDCWKDKTDEKESESEQYFLTKIPCHRGTRTIAQRLGKLTNTQISASALSFCYHLPMPLFLDIIIILQQGTIVEHCKCKTHRDLILKNGID